MNQDDICMQCGHKRRLHDMDGCQCYIADIEGISPMKKCPCVLPQNTGVEVTQC
jgi:hypothetical protein